MASMESILVARGVTKSFPVGRDSLEVLRGIDLAIPRGSFVALVGASGSGKSTLLSLLAGLDQPTSGSIELDGQPLERMSEEERALLRRTKIGFVFQAFHLIPSLTLLENVCLPLAFDQGYFPLERGRALLDRVGLNDRWNFFPDQLSGGERQRTAIARALVHDPALVFADEPTGNLDSKMGRQIFDLLTETTSGRTLILVTHDHDLARHAHRLYEMKDGRLTLP